MIFRRYMKNLSTSIFDRRLINLYAWIKFQRTRWRSCEDSLTWSKHSSYVDRYEHGSSQVAALWRLLEGRWTSMYNIPTASELLLNRPIRTNPASTGQNSCFSLWRHWYCFRHLASRLCRRVDYDSLICVRQNWKF